MAQLNVFVHDKVVGVPDIDERLTDPQQHPTTKGKRALLCNAILSRSDRSNTVKPFRQIFSEAAISAARLFNCIFPPPSDTAE